MAFASLLNDAIRLSTNQQHRLVPQTIRRYPEFPAVKIGRLGVHKDFQRSHIGSKMLDIIKELFLTDNRTGCRFITVDAYNHPSTLAFYRRNDFRPFPIEETNKPTVLMFFDLRRLTI
ncbi:MAG: GNAT family N-acetyltransferase [Thermodesulfobacteriota bacterium]